MDGWGEISMGVASKMVGCSDESGDSGCCCWIGSTVVVISGWLVAVLVEWMDGVC